LWGSFDAWALSEMDRLVRLRRLHLPIGAKTPSRDIAQAIDHVRRAAKRTIRKRRSVHFGSNLIVHRTGITLQNSLFFDGR
jgi:hypothetical protein